MKWNSTSKSAGLALAMISVFAFAFTDVPQALAFKAEAPGYGDTLFHESQFQVTDDSKMKYADFREDRRWKDGQWERACCACCMDTNSRGVEGWSVFKTIAFNHDFDSSQVARDFQRDAWRGFDNLALGDFRGAFHALDRTAFSIAHSDQGSYSEHEALIALHDGNFNSFAEAAFHGADAA